MKYRVIKDIPDGWEGSLRTGQGGNRTMNSIKVSTPIEIQLSELCTQCLGSGKQRAMQRAMTYECGSIRYKDKKVKCEACKGTGRRANSDT